MTKSKKHIEKKWYKSKLLWSLAIIGIFFSYLFIIGLENQSQESIASFSGKKITVYKNPYCGCCEGHIEAYKEAGFKVNVVEHEKLDSIKQEHGIPPHAQSCHTAVMDNYFIEGHMPMKAIEKLLKEQPNIDGIALPGMPSGTPGMPGPKMGDYEVLSLDNKETDLFLSI